MVSHIEPSNSTVYRNTNTLQSTSQIPDTPKQEQARFNSQISPDLSISADALKLSTTYNNQNSLESSKITTEQEAQQSLEKLKNQFNDKPTVAQNTQIATAQLVMSLMTNIDHSHFSNA